MTLRHLDSISTSATPTTKARGSTNVRLSLFTGEAAHCAAFA
jgi:hypothetical protein